MKYQNENFSGTHQHRGWSDYIGPNSMTRWIIQKLWGFTDVELYRISESVRPCMYLILSLQASARLRIIGNMASALTAQKAFLNDFENDVNCRVDIQEDTKNYQYSYTSSKVDYSMGEGIYMLTSDMSLNIKAGTAGYNNEILVFDSGFSLGRNDMVNTSASEKSSRRTPIIPKQIPMPKAVLPLPKHTSAITHEDEGSLWYSF